MKNRYLLTELKYKIDSKRNLMISTALLKGFNHPKTIKCSQELDVLLNKHYQINCVQKHAL